LPPCCTPPKKHCPAPACKYKPCCKS
uniref:Kappa-conotoxin RIIIJ n=1 Tax=Conus radiatus TaxID=61198 RepID=CM3J_CONRA|nr:RecName: Full=Kappa-conotoxin RIIIJ; Short=Kappa-M-RIIIJ [Conus radiatus]